MTTYNVSSGEDDGEAEGRDDDARREEDGQLLAGVAGRVCVIHHSPGDAVRDRGEDVEEEEEQRPVFAADRENPDESSHTGSSPTQGFTHVCEPDLQTGAARLDLSCLFLDQCVRECVCTYSYAGRAHPSMRNMRPMAPPKDRLMRALQRQKEGK